MAELDVAALRRLVQGIDLDLGNVVVSGQCRRDWVDQRHAILDALESAERVEKAAREVQYEIERMLALGDVPQLKQVGWWGGRLGAALEGGDG